MVSLLAVVLTATVAFVARLLLLSGDLYKLKPVLLGQGGKGCTHLLPELHGFEDFAKIDGGFITIASDHSHFRFTFGISMREAISKKVGMGGSATNFNMFYVDDSHSEQTPVQLIVEHTPPEFFPHGLVGTGKILVAVNHRSDIDALEIFDVDVQSSKAMHVASATHGLLFNVNDCTISDLVDKDTSKVLTVFCSNWRSQTTGTILDFVEVYGQLPWSNVVKCEIQIDLTSPVSALTSCSVAATGLKMSNGVEISPDGSTVVVVTTLGKEVVLYDLSDGNLVENRRINTNAACDNLMWSSPTTILSGCHPQALRFAMYSTNPSENFSPSEVVRISFGDSTVQSDSIETLLLDSTGYTVSGSSVAALTSDSALLVGTVHDKGILRCSFTNDTLPQHFTRSWGTWGIASVAALSLLFASVLALLLAL